MWMENGRIAWTCRASPASRHSGTKRAADRAWGVHGRRRRWSGAGLAAIAAGALALVACGDSTTGDEAVLDLDTLEAESDFGTFEAERAQDSFVGPIGDGQAIGITSLEEAQGGQWQDLEPGDDVAVYLYERQQIALMMGALDEDGTATLESEELSDFDSTADIELEDDVVTGTVTFRDEPPAQFTAEEATGVGGVYWATGTDLDPMVSADWVVLPDERQWGCVCSPPGTAACCHLGRF